MNKPSTLQGYARLAGLLYLFIIAAGIFGQIAVRGALVVPGDAVATAERIASAQTLWRWGLIGDLLMHLADIPVMVLLYQLFRRVHQPLAAVALGFNLVQTAVLVVNKLSLVIPLQIMRGKVAVSPDAAREIGLWVAIHDQGFGLGLLFFGAACLLYGVLAYRSGFLPRTIGVLIAAAGAAYLVNSLTLFLAPDGVPAVTPLLLLSLVGELSFSFWLVFKGVRGGEARVR